MLNLQTSTNVLIMNTTVAKMRNAGIQMGAILASAMAVISATASHVMVRKLFYKIHI